MKRRYLFILGAVLVVASLFFGKEKLDAAVLTVPSNGRVFWVGTNQQVIDLDGWSRDTDFDGKYLQGGASGFTASANGGGSSPSHTANAHNHTGNSHTHNFSANIKDASNAWVENSGGPQIAYEAMTIPAGHTHQSKTSNSATFTYANTTPTVGAASDEPPHITVIVIKPDDANQDIPDDAVVFTADTSLPGGDFVKYAAADDRFLKGAAGGADGGTTDGSATHNHTSSHTHTATGASHASIRCGNANTSALYNGTTPTSTVARSQHHVVTLSGAGTGTLTSDDGNIASVNGEPAYVELLGIQNTSGSATTPVGVIVGYIGAEADIELGWELYGNATNKQVRSTPTDGDVEITGGANSHDHGTSSSHTHTHGTHTHTTSVQQSGTYNAHNTPQDVEGVVLDAIHKHTWNVTDVAPSVQSKTFTMSSDDGRFEYRTMIFIKRVTPPPVHIKGNVHILGNTLILNIGILLCTVGLGIPKI